MKEQSVNVVCMKWGTSYGSDYVNRLYGMVGRNLRRPFRFYCITDDVTGIRSEVIPRIMPDFPLPRGARGPWQKLIMFQENLFDIVGKTMFLDLDVVIVGPLDRFFDYSRKFAVRHEFDKRKENDNFGNTSMYVFEKEHCLPAWPSRLWRTPALPEGASVLAFHGRPLPEDAIAGKWPLEDKPFWKAVYKHTRPCRWLAGYWRE